MAATSLARYHAIKGKGMLLIC